MQLTYSHCIKFTFGQLDRYPWSEYERRTVDCAVKVWPEDLENDKEEYQIIVNGMPVSSAQPNLEMAINDASYNLMSMSRERARQAAIYPTKENIEAAK